MVTDMKRYLFPLFYMYTIAVQGQSPLHSKAAQLSELLEPKLIAWRRDIHQHPELSNREFKTAEKVAAHLKTLGLEVKTNVGHTGVIGILKGGKPGPVIALRADMDALPVTERQPLPFASSVKSTFRGQEVGVMHACGHDTHVAILMATAEALSRIKGELKGTVKFIFQPAEEGAPDGEEGGAQLLVKEGVLENPKVEAIFGLHINSLLEIGKIAYKPGGINAAVDEFKITVTGKQTHGAYPWLGVDPIVTSAQIITSLQTIVSRNLDITSDPAVITIGAIHGGIRENIIPEKVEMIGTIRSFDTSMQSTMHRRIYQTASKIAEAAGAKADVEIEIMYPVTYNSEMLTAKMLPSLQRAAGTENVLLMKAKTGAEDFAFYQQKVPGLFFYLGGRPHDVKEADAPPHHTPDFFIDEAGLKLGVKTFCYLVLDYFDENRN
jgi:amidohydrolase